MTGSCEAKPSRVSYPAGLSRHREATDVPDAGQMVPPSPLTTHYCSMGHQPACAPRFGSRTAGIRLRAQRNWLAGGAPRLTRLVLRFPDAAHLVSGLRRAATHVARFEFPQKK
jgi:hypothetical protein